MLWPSSNSEPVRPFREANDCHNPAGSPEGGRFCSDKPHGPLSVYPYAPGSKKIPSYLKDEVARARRAGINVYHSQQPEPVKDATGLLNDPLAKTYARHGDAAFIDDKGILHHTKGQIHLTTRGGEYEPTRPIYDEYGFARRHERKELSPADLRDPATEDDVASTFRHEVGHLMRRSFRGTDSTPRELASEIAAWQYALEISPTHSVSQKMVRRGLQSHAYHAYRTADLVKGMRHGFTWDREEGAERTFQQEISRGEIDVPTMNRARKFTARVMRSLNNYSAVLKRKGLKREPFYPAPYFTPPTVIPGGPYRGGA